MALPANLSFDTPPQKSYNDFLLTCVSRISCSRKNRQMTDGPLRQGILVDRDGVLIQDRSDYVRTVAHVQLLPQVTAAIGRLWEAGYTVCVVTNQSGIAKGLYSHSDVAAIHRFIEAELHRQSGDGRMCWYYCPHQDSDNCTCRKPQSGLLLNALQDQQLLPAQTWMVGDSMRDIEAGIQVGCHTALVRTGYGSKQLLQTDQLYPEAVFADLWQMVCYLLNRKRSQNCQT